MPSGWSAGDAAGAGFVDRLVGRELLRLCAQGVNGGVAAAAAAAAGTAGRAACTDSK